MIKNLKPMSILRSYLALRRDDETRPRRSSTQRNFRRQLVSFRQSTFFCWQWALFVINIFTPDVMVMILTGKIWLKGCKMICVKRLEPSSNHLKSSWLIICENADANVKTKRDQVDLGLIIMRITARETGVTWHRHLTRAAGERK